MLTLAMKRSTLILKKNKQAKRNSQITIPAKPTNISKYDIVFYFLDFKIQTKIENMLNMTKYEYDFLLNLQFYLEMLLKNLYICAEKLRFYLLL